MRTDQAQLTSVAGSGGTDTDTKCSHRRRSRFSCATGSPCPPARRVPQNGFIEIPLHSPDRSRTSCRGWPARQGGSCSARAAVPRHGGPVVLLHTSTVEVSVPEFRSARLHLRCWQPYRAVRTRVAPTQGRALHRERPRVVRDFERHLGQLDPTSTWPHPTDRRRRLKPARPGQESATRRQETSRASSRSPHRLARRGRGLVVPPPSPTSIASYLGVRPHLTDRIPCNSFTSSAWIRTSCRFTVRLSVAPRPRAPHWRAVQFQSLVTDVREARTERAGRRMATCVLQGRMPESASENTRTVEPRVAGQPRPTRTPTARSRRPLPT